ncbi:MAG: trypsin-like serine protease [Myxococcota bacterium]
MTYARSPFVVSTLAFAAAALTLVGSIAHAARPTSSIVGGDSVPGCGWPNVVRITTAQGNFFCSGTLIHPSIVATAGHCVAPALNGDDPPPAELVLFGDGEGEPDLVREVDFCMVHPDFVNTPAGIDFNNLDLAFCQLDEPVEDFPIVPLAYGCDYEEFEMGDPAVLVGFGRDEANVSGKKRALDVSVVLFEPSGEIQLSAGMCEGDSGGAAFRRAADDTWRQVGINSHRLFAAGGPTACGEAGVSVATAAWQLAPLIEGATDFDVTPCHDLAGNWEPSWECQGVPLQPEAGGPGSYAEGCVELERSGFLDSCGAALPEDETPPNVEVVTPADGMEFPDPGDSAASVEFVVEADDGEGWGIAEVTLEIESAEGDTIVETLIAPPYTWTIDLVRDSYLVRAVAEDNAGLVTETDWQTLGVGAPAVVPDADSGGTASGDEGGGTVADTDSPAAGEGEADGCACRARPTSSVPAGLTIMVLVWLRRRPRCRRACPG